MGYSVTDMYKKITGGGSSGGSADKKNFFKPGAAKGTSPLTAGGVVVSASQTPGTSANKQVKTNTNSDLAAVYDTDVGQIMKRYVPKSLFGDGAQKVNPPQQKTISQDNSDNYIGYSVDSMPSLPTQGNNPVVPLLTKGAGMMLSSTTSNSSVPTLDSMRNNPMPPMGLGAKATPLGVNLNKRNTTNPASGVIGSQHILLAPTIDRSAHTTSVGNSNLLTPPPMQPEQQLKISQVAANASRNSFMGQPHTPVDMSDASMAKQSTLAGAGSVPNKFTPGVAGGFGLNKFAPGAAGFGTAVGGGDPTMPDSYGQPDTYDCAICQGGGDSFDLSDLGGFDSTDDSGDVQVKKGWGDLGAITAIVDMIDAMWRFMSGEKESSSCSDCDFCDEVKKCIKEDKKTPVSGGGGAITVACDSGSTSYSGIQTIKLDCTELQLSSLTPSSVDISLKPGFWGGVTDNVSIVYVSGVSFNSTSCTFTTTMSTLTFSFNNGIFTGVS